jgi:hypothetical protein
MAFDKASGFHLQLSLSEAFPKVNAKNNEWAFL